MHNGYSNRLSRKIEHLELAKILPDGPVATGFEDISLVHQAASPINLDEVKTTSSLFTKKLNVPFLINAITGGPDMTANINASLARVAKELGIGMAIGSQRLALEVPELKATYTIARKENPHGLILANLSALSPPESVLQAIEMLSADGVQLHLNFAQELAMKEGDRNFNRVLDHIALVLETSPVPVIIKEVGFGISGEVAYQLWEQGVRYIDVGGQGGTNFGVIERCRQGSQQVSGFEYWGIPTSISIAEVTAQYLPLTIIASGGIRNGLDAIKALALGASFVAIAGPMVKLLLKYSEQELLVYLNELIYEFRSLMLLTGSRSLSDLKKIPVVITGKTKDWLDQRGILDSFRKRTIMAAKHTGC